MKNILVLTSEYPNPFCNYDTAVVHYFVREWVKLGCNVRVYHYRSTFPKKYYFFAKLFKQGFKKLFKTDFIPTSYLVSAQDYTNDGIKTTTVPIFKLWPHLNYPISQLDKAVELILQRNGKEKFIPDCIVGHFANPQIALIPRLKIYYPDSITSLVIHEDINLIFKKFGKKINKDLNSFTRIGFRYKAAKNQFEKILPLGSKGFLCYSGVPDKYLLEAPRAEKHAKQKTRVCFVGMLIPLKNVKTTILALNESFPDKMFDFKIVGDGIERSNLDSLVKELGLQDCVTFVGKVSRDVVQEILSDTDVFVMVSAPEAFGLVYLEAMAKGCLVIGSRDQGIDGVIKDDINGFLCRPKNVKDLADKLKKIRMLSESDRYQISENALATAREMTDNKVAGAYLNNILECNHVSDGGICVK